MTDLGRGGMGHRSDALGRFFVKAKPAHHLRHRVARLVYDQIGIFRVLNKETTRRGVAGEDEAKSVPFQTVAHWAVIEMNRGEAADDHTILVIHYLSFGKVEFMNLDLRAGFRQHAMSGVNVPSERFHLTAYEMF